MSLDDEIRALYTELAATAPDPVQARAGIAAKARAWRQRRLLVTAGGALTIATAAGLPYWFLSRPVPSDAEGLLKVVPGKGFPLPFTPGWLPDEFTARSTLIATDVPGPQVRRWGKSSGDYPVAELRLSVDTGPSPKPATVDVNGAPGQQDENSVSWQPVPGVTLSVQVSNMDDPAIVALRIARSTERDRVEYLDPTMNFGVLPTRFSLQRAFIRERETDGLAAFITTPRIDMNSAIYVFVRPTPDDDFHLASATPATLRGLPGWRLPNSDRHSGEYAVQLADGRWLYAGSALPDLTDEELIEAVNTVKLG